MFLLIALGVIDGTPVLLIVARIHVVMQDILVPIQPIQLVAVSYIHRVVNTKIAIIVHGNLFQRMIQGRGKIQCKKVVAGLDVINLQKVLNKEGVYPEAIYSGYYGSLTESAVKRFQAKYYIVGYGNPSTTGYGRVGWATMAKLNALYKSASF